MSQEDVSKLEQRLEKLEQRFDNLIWTIAISGASATGALVMFVLALLSQHKG